MNDEIEIKMRTEWEKASGSNPWIVDGLIHESCTLIYARRINGKSLLTVDLAHALATGEHEWLGRKVYGAPYGVAFGVSDPHAVYETARRQNSLETPDMPLFRARRGRGPKYWHAIAEALSERDIKVLVLDSGTNLVSDVNSPSDVGNLMDGLEEILTADISIVLVHHVSASNDSAGCYVWTSWPRHLVRMTKNGDTATLKIESNEPTDLRDLTVKFPRRDRRSSRFRLTDPENRPQKRSVNRQEADMNLLTMMKERNNWKSQEEIGRALEVSQKTVSRILSKNGHELVNGSVVPKPFQRPTLVQGAA